MHKLKAILCALLSACIMAVPFASAMVSVGAEEQTVEQKIAELDKQSAEYQAVLDQTASDISKKEEYGETLLSQIAVMNERIILTREAIEKLNTSIKGKQGEIDKQNEEIDDQIDALCERLSLIYMAGSASNLEILLGAKDFGDFIDKVELVKTLSAYDKQMIGLYKRFAEALLAYEDDGLLGEYEVPQTITDGIFVANITGNVVNFYLPVSFEDLRYQLYWYGYDLSGENIMAAIMDDEEEVEDPIASVDGKHSLDVHPTKEQIAAINEHYPASHDGEQFRDYHVLKLGLLKK